MPYHRSLTAIALATTFLSTTATATDADLSQPVPKAANLTPSAMPPGTDRALDFKFWKSDLAVNDVVGQIEKGGLFCGEAKPLRYSQKLDKWLLEHVTRSFKEQASLLGFSPPDSSRSLFEDKAGSAADFRVGATLLHLDYRVCASGEVKGEAYAKVKWEVFSTRRQRVVYADIVEANFASDKRMPEFDFGRAFTRVMVGNLLGAPKFVDVIRSGGAGEEPAATALATLQLSPGPTVTSTLGKDASGFLAAVVTVESGVGSGSAFYISRDGYLLTNAHVVANDKFVRIKLANGKTLVGEVLRKDRQRDVALLRTDAISAEILSVRLEAPRVGEEVYAIGSPYGDVLSGSVTKGILSSRRVMDGTSYLQSDVTLNPGNSGGPLIDSKGRVIGIAMASAAPGINMFVPVDEALEKLAVTLK